MVRQSSLQAWRWLMVLLGLACWVSIGCSPAMISMAIMPWMDNNIAPEYKLFAADKELTLVLLTNFSQPPLHPDLSPAEAELPEKLAMFFRKRCQENKHKIKIVPHTEVRNYHLKQLALGEANPLDVGKHFKADFVLDLSIQSFSLYEKNAYPQMFRGNSEIAINLYKVDAKDGEYKVFSKINFRAEYPGARGPIDAGSTSPVAFRDVFLTKVAHDISKMFIAYPPEERIPFE